jgi:FixJ family two-component response regulator
MPGATVTERVISIIEDDKATRAALSGLMRARGFATRTFSCAEDFLAEKAFETSHCIITDIHMPGLTGIELKEQLDRAQCSVPIIMITARLEESTQRRALASGALCLLRKPLNTEALMACVESALAEARVAKASV